MYRAASRPSTRRDTVLFTSCVAVSLALRLAPGDWTQSMAELARDTALRPVIWLQGRAEEGRTSRARLVAVRDQRDSLAVALSDRALLGDENAQLRELLDLRARTPRAFLAAEVLRQPLPTEGRTLLLSVGAEDGVAPFQPVITAEGLVGVVARVDARSAVVNTWAHPEFRASGVTEAGEVLGIVAPDASAEGPLGWLEFRGVAYRDTVIDGAIVMTAGLGGVYPRGIPLGRVRGVAREELGWERVYRLVPSVNPATISHVLLLYPRDPAIVEPADTGAHP